MLDSLKQHLHSDLPKPFAQSAQYQKNFKETVDEDGEAKQVSGAASTKKKKKKPKSKVDVKRLPVVPVHADEDENPNPNVYKANEYNKARKEYTASVKDELGLTPSEANKSWNDSTQKKRLLGGLSVPELRRRRFIPKGCDHNPWASAAWFNISKDNT